MPDLRISNRRMEDEHDTRSRCQTCGCERGTAGGDPPDMASQAPPARDFVAEGCGPDGRPLDDTPSMSYPLASVMLSNGAVVPREMV